jgi:hypothetical protein
VCTDAAFLESALYDGEAADRAAVVVGSEAGAGRPVDQPAVVGSVDSNRATVRRVRVTHKVDYGVRLMATIAELDREAPGRPITRHALAARDQLPPGFLGDISRSCGRPTCCAATVVARAAGRSPARLTRSPSLT